MPYALVIIGLILIITGILNTYAQLAAQLQSDFTGSNGFIVWMIALGLVGAMGYIKDLREFSHYFMALILISFILSNKGVFQKFTAAIKAGPTAPTAGVTSDISIPITIQQAGSAANTALGVPAGTSAGTNVSNAATGNNAGSSMIGSITAPWASAVRGWFGLSPVQ